MLKTLSDWLGTVAVSPLLITNKADSVASDPATLRKVAAAQTELLFEMDRGSGFMPVLVFLIATVLLSDFGTPMPWAAFAVYCASWVYLHGLQFSFMGDADRADAPESWSRRFAVASLFTGIAWGMGSVAWFDPGNTENQAVVALVILGVNASSAISRAMHKPSMISFAIPSGAPIVIALAITAAPFGMMMAVLGLIFLTGLLEWSKSVNQSQLESIALRFQNDSLVSSLKQERATALEAKRQAEAGNRAKTEFLTTMSHEVRTPLNGIMGMAHILQTSDLDKEQKEHIDVIVESGETLQTVLNDILDLSKLEAGRFDVSSESFEVLPVISGVLRLFKSNADSKGVELEVHTDPSKAAYARADDHRTRQVLLNLVGNAIKFTERGEIAVCLAPVGSALLPDGLPSDLPPDHIVVAVTDTGIGVAPDRLEQLFHPFTQADQSTTRRYGGTGLGLAISKRLVELMGGRIGGMSNEGVGSVFWFCLPAARGTAENTDNDNMIAEEKSTTAGRFILLAEDNDVNALVAEALLKQQNHDVVRVRDGAAAVEFISSRLADGTRLPDLILMDIRMPRLSGPEAAQEIRALPSPANRLPILALTADLSYSEVREDGSLIIPKEYAGVFDGALAKPIMPDQLYRAIDVTTSAAVRLSGMDQDGTAVDLSRLKGILDILGTSAFSDLIETYIADMDKMTVDLASAVDASDHARAASLSHSLAGASANLGFVALEAAARELMRAANSEDSAALAAGHTSFTGAVDEARKAVGALKAG